MEPKFKAGDLVHYILDDSDEPMLATVVEDLTMRRHTAVEGEQVLERAYRIRVYIDGKASTATFCVWESDLKAAP